jgi:hypothetical protein
VLTPGAYVRLAGRRSNHVAAGWRATSSTTPLRARLRAVFANFGTNGDFKGLPRDEYYFVLSYILRVTALGPKLGPRPYLSHRVPPLADLKRPLPEEDILRIPVQPEGPFPVDPSIKTPMGLKSTWTSVAYAWKGDWVASYNYPDQRVHVAELALQALTTGPAPFVGDTAKAVDQIQRTPNCPGPIARCTGRSKAARPL